MLHHGYDLNLKPFSPLEPKCLCPAVHIHIFCPAVYTFSYIEQITVQRFAYLDKELLPSCVTAYCCRLTLELGARGGVVV
jgi:hypothetical protein